ncbi:hypothetical protein QTL95_18295 [Rhizobium sp. S152]|uniref:hypothetical protein n=1 Tax=Rhizobium sp. S152 TaxID=3055038 RepID=UPI0025A9E3F2|nr:hypothetical protein [Rhizobium sp. S152]MDM9627845.1 hypothetical protein [Rhizobium sp. S152]
MKRRFGETCSSNDILMTVRAANLAYDLTKDWSEHHVRLADRIATMAWFTKRPLLVPAQSEFYALVRSYSNDAEIRAVYQSRRKPIYAHVDSDILAAIVKHERAAANARIEAARAA